MKRINKNIGAKVQVKNITIAINPKVGWEKLKNVSGVIIKNNEKYEQYYHLCDGNYTNVKKHIIKHDWFPTYAIKLDNNVKDIEGNNIIIVREHDLKFLERIEISKKRISKKQYLNAKKIIEQYNAENGEIGQV